MADGTGNMGRDGTGPEEHGWGRRERARPPGTSLTWAFPLSRLSEMGNSGGKEQQLSSRCCT